MTLTSPIWTIGGSNACPSPSRWRYRENLEVLERRSLRRLALGVILVPPFALVAALAPVSVFTWGPLAAGLLLVPPAFVAASAGYPLWALGRRLAAKSR